LSYTVLEITSFSRAGRLKQIFQVVQHRRLHHSSRKKDHYSPGMDTITTMRLRRRQRQKTFIMSRQQQQLSLSLRLFLVPLCVVHFWFFKVDAFVGVGVSFSIKPSKRHEYSTTTATRSLIPLFVSVKDSSSSSSSSTSHNNKIRYLGSGLNATVREGVVLLSPVEEYHHFLRQAAVFIYAMGYNENAYYDDDEFVIRGVIIDHPTPFTMKEMMITPINQDDQATSSTSVTDSSVNTTTTTTTSVYDNFIFRGGDTGGESAFCLHSVQGLTKNEIGTSGIFQGGDIANAFSNNNNNNNNNSTNNTNQVKFFFNYMEFTEQEMEDMLNVTHQDGDGWTAVEVPPDLVLSSNYSRGEAWARLRNAVREDIELHKLYMQLQQQQRQ
jgi:hypothetical protein